MDRPIAHWRQAGEARARRGQLQPQKGILYQTAQSKKVAESCLTRGCAQSLQSCPVLCDPTDCSPAGFSVLGILQARVLEWVAMPASRGSSLIQRSKQHLLQLLYYRQILYLLSHLGSPTVRFPKSQCSLWY